MIYLREKTKDERVRSERQRLKKLYAQLEPARKALAAGLIERAAFMRIECEDLEEDLRINGWTELFQQAKGMEPYDRARPQGQSYQSLNGNYLKIIKQLDSLLPQEGPAVGGGDGFEDFVTGRDAQ